MMAAIRRLAADKEEGSARESAKPVKNQTAMIPRIILICSLIREPYRRRDTPTPVAWPLNGIAA
ncbi:MULTISPECIES: hypothetical protein [unclassified Achromobacter]|uniref:hypothetical protein n=1 Tax=unclassified Achromobacter TaxID=2626865 RepID=UPI001178ABC5|nr:MULTISPECIES: hypothetical protein [unclassified Achromobacter]